MVSDTPSDERSIEAAWQLNPRHFPRRIDLDLLSRAVFSEHDGLN